MRNLALRVTNQHLLPPYGRNDCKRIRVEKCRPILDVAGPDNNLFSLLFADEDLFEKGSSCTLEWFGGLEDDLFSLFFADGDPALEVERPKRRQPVLPCVRAMRKEKALLCYSIRFNYSSSTNPGKTLSRARFRSLAVKR
jgi:hypothetical protein